jgi:RNA polymerase sigma-70 factor (ECF subfamily)
MAVARAVEGAAEGLVEPAAFPAFYERTLPRIYGYFLRRCGGVATVAEDLTQETYLAAVRELKRRRGVDDPLPWLYGIARHKLLDHYRRQDRARGRLVPWHDALEREPDLPPLDPAAVETQVRLSAALARLPEGQRTVVVLRYLDGLPVPAVAAAVGKSVHATESLLARGRATLRRTLADLNDPDDAGASPSTSNTSTETGHG